VKDFGKYNLGKQLGNPVLKRKKLAKKHYCLRRLFKNCIFVVEERKGKFTQMKAISTKAAIATTTLFGTPTTSNVL
jgi:hypothetical protein